VRRKLLFEILSFQDYLQIVSELEKIGAKVETIGYSSLNKPLHCIKLGEGDTRILAICRLHGNEPATTNAALYFTYLCLTEGRVGGIPMRDVLSKCKIALVPAANPDGLEEYYRLYIKNPKPSWENVFGKARVNAEGVDLNRDWLYLTQKETQCLHILLNEFRPHIVLDMHEFYFKGGYPPQWPDGEEEFMISLTDTPYFMVSESIKDLSREIMERAIDAVVNEGYGHWKIKERWFVGEEKGARREDVVVPATFLGSHVPYEHSAKLLVETWGVGLGEYLLSDRVNIHSLIIAHIAYYTYEKEKEVKEAVSESISEDIAFPEAMFRISGPSNEVNKAEKLLKLHDIAASKVGNEILIKLPQRRSRMASILLDKDFELNRRLFEKRKFYTIDHFLQVKVTKYS